MTRETELWLRFIHSVALADHLGDAYGAIVEYAKKAGLPVPPSNPEDWLDWASDEGVDRGIHGK